jgi:hypothetical protein
MSNRRDAFRTKGAFTHPKEIGIRVVVRETRVVDLTLGEPAVDASRLSDAIEHMLQDLEFLVTNFSFFLQDLGIGLDRDRFGNGIGFRRQRFGLLQRETIP